MTAKVDVEEFVEGKWDKVDVVDRPMICKDEKQKDPFCIPPKGDDLHSNTKFLIIKRCNDMINNAVYGTCTIL